MSHILVAAIAPLPFDNPLWVAGVIAIIGAVGVMVGNLLTQLRNGRKLDDNTKVTEASHAQGAEIKTLVNGTQTALLVKLEASEKALNAAHGEIRALREILTTLAAQLPKPATPLPESETRSGPRDPHLALTDPDRPR